MDILKESYLREYQQRELLANLERKRQIHEALAAKTRRSSHILAEISHLMRALGNARKIRIEISLDYNESQPETANC